MLLWVLYATAIGLGLIAILLGALFVVNKRAKVMTHNQGDFIKEAMPLVETVAVVVGLVFVGMQAAELEKSVQAGTVQSMVNAQRDVFGRMLDHPELFEVLTGQEESGQSAEAVYLSMVINHGFNAYTLREKDFIDDDWWHAIVEDMKDVYQRGRMRARWDRVRRFYPKRYQQFVDKELLERTNGGGR